MNQRQDGWLFLIGIILAVITEAWISSVFAVVEARIANRPDLNLMYSQFSILFNTLFIIHVTIAGTMYFHIPLWRVIIVDIILIIPMFFLLF